MAQLNKNTVILKKDGLSVRDVNIELDKTGDLATLTTTDKTSLVNAINENKTSISSILGTSNASVAKLKAITLNVDTRSTLMTYDGSNRLSTVQDKDGTTVIKTTTLTYNATTGLLETITEVAGGVTVTTTLTYTSGALSNTTKVVS